MRALSSVSSVLVTSFVLALAACGGGADDALLGGRATDPAGGDPQDPGQVPDGPAPTCKDVQTSYVGLGGIKLEGTRLDTPLGQERMRTKPFGALRDDYRRVLGLEPASLASSGPTFGEAPARWYEEPAASAVMLYQAYRVAFDGCLEVTKAEPRWADAPTLDKAKAECATWARTYWNRTPIPAEIDACAEVAVTGSLKEAVPGGDTKDTEPRRRWAYACASVLSSGGFLAY